MHWFAAKRNKGQFLHIHSLSNHSGSNSKNECLFLKIPPLSILIWIFEGMPHVILFEFYFFILPQKKKSSHSFHLFFPIKRSYLFCGLFADYPSPI